jgi:hypothetical protein
MLIVLLATPMRAAAQQTEGAYVTGSAGGSFGDANATGSFSVGFGYLTPRRVGLEIELAWTPSTEETTQLAIPTPVFPSDIFGIPEPELSLRSRLLTLQTNVVGVIAGDRRRARAFVEAGGGIADVQRRVHIKTFVPVFPPLSDLFVEPVIPPLTFTTIERDVSSSQTALVLGAGAEFDYRLGAHLALGTHVRYEHLFTSGDALDKARVEARARWGF